MSCGDASLVTVLTYSKKAQDFTKLILSSTWGPGYLYNSLLCLFRASGVLYFQTLVTSRTLSPFLKPLTWSSLGRYSRMRSSGSRMGLGWTVEKRTKSLLPYNRANTKLWRIAWTETEGRRRNVKKSGGSLKIYVLKIESEPFIVNYIPIFCHDPVILL